VDSYVCSNLERGPAVLGQQLGLGKHQMIPESTRRARRGARRGRRRGRGGTGHADRRWRGVSHEAERRATDLASRASERKRALLSLGLNPVPRGGDRSDLRARHRRGRQRLVLGKRHRYTVSVHGNQDGLGKTAPQRSDGTGFTDTDTLDHRDSCRISTREGTSNGSLHRWGGVGTGARAGAGAVWWGKTCDPFMHPHFSQRTDTHPLCQRLPNKGITADSAEGGGPPWWRRRSRNVARTEKSSGRSLAHAIASALLSRYGRSKALEVGRSDVVVNVTLFDGRRDALGAGTRKRQVRHLSGNSFHGGVVLRCHTIENTF